MVRRYEIHLHTKYSSCSSLEPLDILRTAQRLHLDGVAVTDHNTIKGALKTRQLVDKMRTKKKGVKGRIKDDFEIIIGEEVSTDIGHVLVYYVNKEIKRGDIHRVIEEARSQGALVVLAHPFNLISEKLSKVLPLSRTSAKVDPELLRQFDAVEVFNSRCLLKKDNELSAKLAERFKIPIVGGSDAHFRNEIGNTLIEFDDRYSFREAVLKGKVRVISKKKTKPINHLRSAASKISSRIRR